MKKRLLSIALALAMTSSAITGCGSKTTSGGNTGKGDVVEMNFPTCWVGVNVAAEWLNNRVEAFNEEYKEKYKVVIEEIPGDQALVDKLKVLYSTDSLPDVIATGGYNLIDMMSDKFVDLTPYLDKDAEWKGRLSEEGLVVNSRGGKVYGVPYTRSVIGYFYNKDLFANAGIDKPAETWDEFFQQLDKLKAAGISTPVSMDTTDSGWITSLMLGAMVAETNEGEKFMNTSLPVDYNTPEMIKAATKIQKLFKEYTTGDAVGGKYENAASNFFMEKTAIIANGPWMVGDFYDSGATLDPKFGDRVGTAKYPGDVMYNSGKVGFHIASKTTEKIEASLEFVKFITNDESQKIMLELTGDVNDSETVVSDKVKPLIMEVINNANNSEKNINDFQSLWYPNVVDEISRQYPLLATGEITPEQFVQVLTDTAKKN